MYVLGKPDGPTRKTDPGPSLEIRLRKTDTAIPKHAACPRLRARSFNATEQMIISFSPLSSCKPQGLRCFYKIGGWKMFINNDNVSCLAFLLGIQQRSFIIHSIKLCLKNVLVFCLVRMSIDAQHCLPCGFCPLRLPE